MIASGEKKEEYREFNMYWGKRFVYTIMTPHGGKFTPINDVMLQEPETAWKNFTGGAPTFQPYDQVIFANDGHFGNVPKITMQFKGISVAEGNPEWGAEPGKKYFVIKLGERVKT